MPESGLNDEIRVSAYSTPNYAKEFADAASVITDSEQAVGMHIVISYLCTQLPHKRNAANMTPTNCLRVSMPQGLILALLFGKYRDDFSVRRRR